MTSRISGSLCSFINWSCGRTLARYAMLLRHAATLRAYRFDAASSSLRGSKSPRDVGTVNESSSMVWSSHRPSSSVSRSVIASELASGAANSSWASLREMNALSRAGSAKAPLSTLDNGPRLNGCSGRPASLPAHANTHLSHAGRSVLGARFALARKFRLNGPAHNHQHVSSAVWRVDAGRKYFTIHHHPVACVV